MKSATCHMCDGTGYKDHAGFRMEACNHMRMQLDMECPVEFGTVPDCDCPHEHWHIGSAGQCLDIHFEDDGTVHVTLDGEVQNETVLHGMLSLDQARPLALTWAAPLIGEVHG